MQAAYHSSNETPLTRDELKDFMLTHHLLDQMEVDSTQDHRIWPGERPKRGD